jgi:hypothetical protein
MARRSVRSRLSGRGFLLLPAAAFAVHQLRYLLGYGSHAGRALTAQGHGYLDSLAPWVVLLLAFALGAFLTRVARAASGRAAGGSGRSFAGLWTLASLGLVATYTIQEALEGLFASSHPGGLSGIFRHGGWWAVVLAVVAGLAVAVLLRIANATVAVAARLVAKRHALASTLSVLRPTPVFPSRPVPLAASAGRAPPVTPRAAAA